MKLYLAGTTFYDGGGSITRAGVFDRAAASRVNLLESFCYIADWQTRNIGNFKSFMLDSGAFTFAYGKGGLDNLDGYLDSYIEFIRENDISLFFELDIDSLVGYENVLGLRKRLEHGTGKQCIPVWHVNRGKDEWLRMCDEYPYVAVGGIAFAAGREKVEPYLPWFTKTAHERGCKVHGLGYTNLTNLQSTGFDSVDSSAWLAGNKCGFVYVYRDGCMTKCEAPSGKKLDSKAAARHNFMQWVKLAEYMEGQG